MGREDWINLYLKTPSVKSRDRDRNSAPDSPEVALNYLPKDLSQYSLIRLTQKNMVKGIKTTFIMYYSNINIFNIK